MSRDEPTAPPSIARQAIVIIHGIGEQRPLETLKNFVRSFRREETFYSKPERLTDSFEARRIKLRKLEDERDGENWIETDIYEYYWAHMLFGMRWRPLMTWARRVVVRAWRAGGTNGKAGQRLHNPRILSSRKFVRVSLAALVLIGAVLLVILGPLGIVVFGLVLIALLALLDWVSDHALLRVVGDISRYLDVEPRNIGQRHAILQGGIALLKALHAERSDLEGDAAPYVYDRIVVVGHSLGSVIGYELIKHYWAQVNRYLTISNAIPERLTRLEAAQLEPDSCQVTEIFQKQQFALWRELGRSMEKDSQLASRALVPPRWLVTDFVTLGSPLTYGAILQAVSAADFSEKTRLRELPTCPPNRSTRDRPGGFAVHLFYEAAGHENDKTLILHHAAPVALTRWTNFFYQGDPVGGKLANIFGYGIRDIQVSEGRLTGPPGAGGRRCNGLQLHMRYWPPFPDHIPELLEILRWRPSSNSRV